MSCIHFSLICSYFLSDQTLVVATSLYIFSSLFLFVSFSLLLNHTSRAQELAPFVSIDISFSVLSSSALAAILF
ncbi:hypothetical protein EV2_023072 [Malus domestica]